MTADKDALLRDAFDLLCEASAWIECDEGGKFGKRQADLHARITAALENKAITEAKRPEPVAWMIELWSMGTPLWFTGEFSEEGHAIFSADANCCVRYPTEKAATVHFNELLLKRPRALLGFDNYKITEHQWGIPAPQSGVPEGMLRASSVTNIPLKDGAFLELESDVWFLIRGDRKMRRLDEFETEFVESAIRAAEQVNAEGQVAENRGDHGLTGGEPVPSAPTPQPADGVVVPRELLGCALQSLRGALDYKDWHWSPDQWQAADEWHSELTALLAAAKEQRK